MENMLSNILTYVQVGTFVLGIIVAISSFVKWRWDTHLKRVDYVRRTLKELREDEILRVAYDTIEYSQHWYDDKFHDNPKIEAPIDSLFFEMNVLCYMYHQKVLLKEDLRPAEYMIGRILNNPETQDYLFNLFHYSKSQQTECAFHDLIMYGEEKRYIRDDFFDPKSVKKGIYHHYLNFNIH